MDIRTILMDHGIEDAAKATVEGDFGDLISQLNDLDQYINQSFRDGIIEEMEARKIAIYINILSDSNKRIQERYDEIINNPSFGEGVARVELSAAKNAYDTSYYDLIAAITYAIEDGKTTDEESNLVDQSYVRMIENSSRLEKALEQALSVIINARSDVAEKNAKEYASKLKSDLLEVTDSISDRLRATEGYIDGSFRDGLISEYEAKNIASYLNSLGLQKTELDNRYNQVYNNYFLQGVPRTNLLDAKEKYNSRYNSLIDTINTAILDNFATPEESNQVRQAFVDLDSALALLVTCLEKAIDSYSQEQANKAEQLAKEYALSVAGEKAEEARLAAEKVAAEEARAALISANAYADGQITEEEQRAIEDAETKLKEAKQFAEDKAEEARQAAESFAQGKIDLADQSRTRLADAQMYLQKVMNLAYLDKTITPDEQREIDEAQRLVDEARGEADTLTKEAILASQKYAEQQAKEAQQAAQEYAEAEAEAKRLQAQAYADGIVTVEEERAILDAQEKLKEAKAHAEAEAAQAEQAAKLHTDTESKAVKDYTDEQVEEVKKEVVYKVEIISSNGLIFKNGQVQTTLEARVYHGSKDITDTIDANRFRWKKQSGNPEEDLRWNNNHFGGTKTVVITPQDIYVRATFSCEILDE